MPSRPTIGLAALGAVLVLGACSSSGGGASQNALESKLKKEPQIQQLLQQGGTKAKVTDQVVECIAKALEKDASKSDLKNYVNGKMNLDDIGGKGKGSADNAKAQFQTCAQQKVQSDHS